VGVALCSTSLGTTFVVINSASKTVDFSQTRIGTVLISAAILDDVCGLVLVSVIHQLRDIADSGANLGWIIGRPILASGLMAILTPISVIFVARPLYRLPLATRIIAKANHLANIMLMVLVLCAFLAIAAYAGASVLFGAFLAGTFLSSLPSKHEDRDTDKEQGLGMASFLDTFAKYLGDAQRFILQPLFFASIGFAIPFLELWTGEVIWKGIVFTLIMVFSKFIVGLTVPVWDLIAMNAGTRTEKASSGGHKSAVASSWPSATLLGAAMVARGEIGLLIVQIGFNETPYLSHKAFVIAVWAIVLNTIIGPVSVGFLVKRIGTAIAKDPRWGIQKIGSKDPGTDTALGDNLGDERAPEEGRAA
jgi:Kef-type K+ transport system membrane component KefB